MLLFFFSTFSTHDAMWSRSGMSSKQNAADLEKLEPSARIFTSQAPKSRHNFPEIKMFGILRNFWTFLQQKCSNFELIWSYHPENWELFPKKLPKELAWFTILRISSRRTRSGVCHKILTPEISTKFERTESFSKNPKVDKF